MLLTATLFALLSFSGTISLETVLTLAEVPEERDLYLQNILHIEIDEKGGFFAVDYPSAKIFHWRADGSFATTHGSKGEGPGEFLFAAALGPPMGFISMLDNNIYVYDGASRMVNVLDREFQFVRQIRFEGLGGKINGFHVLAADSFLFYDSFFCDNEPCRRILNYDGKGRLLSSWRDAYDDTWSVNQSTGKVSLYIWQPNLVMGFNREWGEVALAHSSKPQLEIRDLAGKVSRTLKLKIPAPSVTQDDIDEYNSQTWFRNSPHLKAVFPDEKSHFDQVLVLKDGYLVYHLSPLYREAKGYFVDRRGKVMGRFRLECGESGGLFAPKGRLMAALVDDEGDFTLKELKIKRP